MTKLFSNVQFTTASFALIGMNLIPLIGVFWFGWDVSIIIFLYWLENVVIGLLNIPKILSCRAPAMVESGHPKHFGDKVFISVFFSIHYGIFCFGHYSFLSGFFETLPEWSRIIPAIFSPLVFWSLLGLTLSHIVSMFVNFYGNGEYKTRRPNSQMFMPYTRIVILHIVIVFGGGFALAMGQGLATLMLLVAVKIGFDLAAHLAEHSEKESLIAPSVG